MIQIICAVIGAIAVITGAVISQLPSQRDRMTTIAIGGISIVATAAVPLLLKALQGTRGGKPGGGGGGPPPDRGNTPGVRSFEGGRRAFPDGRQAGVWMVRVSPAFARREGFPTTGDTFLHFSWNRTMGGRSYLRNYCQLPVTYRWFDPSTVLEDMDDLYVEYPQTARKPVEDGDWWNGETRRLNEQLRRTT